MATKLRDTEGHDVTASKGWLKQRSWGESALAACSVLLLSGLFGACIGAGKSPGGKCPDACAESYPNVPACFSAVWSETSCTCALVALGADAPCDDSNACTLEDRCNTNNQCVGQLIDLGSYCDDQDDCTEDNCDQFAGCVHDARASDTPCDDGNICTFDSRCNEQARCSWTNQYVCGLCADDGDCAEGNAQQDKCNGTLECVSGYCQVARATVPRCNDPRLDPCLVPSCEGGTCQATPLPNNTRCSDLSACTKEDTCQAGVCTGTPVAAAACQCDSLDDCASFDDGDACNGVMACRDGICMFDFASIVVCPNGADTACAVNTCDPGTGACRMLQADDATACDDDDPCTPAETDVCQGGLCVGVPRDCSDRDGRCQVGVCDRLVGCTAKPAEPGSACIPAEPCASGGACNAEGDCVATTVGCDDADPCTVDGCNEVTGQCDHIGPERPGCAAFGVCAGGVPLRCELGEYRCDYARVSGWSAVEKCDERDDDCDGATDEACIAGEACSEGSLLAAWSGNMQACAGVTTVAAASCGTGWHVCSYASMVDSLGGDNPPSGYYIAASIQFDPDTGYSVLDSSSDCFEFKGVCTSAREVQAMSWDGVFGSSVAYAAEAWGCDNGQPSATCASVEFAGVMCCADTCDSDDDCADDSPCTHDTCVSGRCENTVSSSIDCAQVGVCANLKPVCGSDGTLSCGYAGIAGWEAVEATCDGLDNDCDGATDALDADFVVAGEVCELEAGVCAGATKRAGACVEGTWSFCGPSDYGAKSPYYEDAFEGLCDGRDNNCDGQTDGGFAWRGRLIGQSCEGVGECGAGVVECAPSRNAAMCSTNASGSVSGASRELCNGLDDDCDGETDEVGDLDLSDAACGGAGVCAGLPLARCASGAWVCDTQGVPEYGSEICDGLDNDCDGEVDEGFAVGGKSLGSACGPSNCPNGVVICSADGLSARCSSDIAPDYEVCDGLDNDCSGETDEGIEYADPLLGDRDLGQTCSGRGECGAGLVECGPDRRAMCSSLPGGALASDVPERCNRKDDDCDGHTDEGYRWNGLAIGVACTAPGVCGGGHVECSADGAAAICSTLSGGSQARGALETCNGLDDDCDGYTDENVVPAADDCPQQGVCRAEMLDAVCDGAQGWRCSYATNPYYQAGNELGLCDHLDNDCDGETDEDFPSLGQACDGPDVDQCARGTTVCDPRDPTKTMCLGDHASAEVCNGQDDDCDGQTDELGAAGCSVYYEDKDGDGYGTAVSRCACAPGGDFTAQLKGDCNDAAAAINPGAPEVCNGQDDDCDGKTDAADAADLVVDDVVPCEQKLGVCAGTNKNANRCVGGAWQACQQADYVARNGAYQVKETRCDGLDNDCNGAVDGVDANIAANRPLCELQLGQCNGAVKPLNLCTAAGWGACTTAVYLAHAPAYEAGIELSCDGKDNECDGQIDDDFTFGGKKVGQSCDGTGACGLGSVECNVARTGATCSTNADGSARQDIAETCNGIDDDCDGAIDDGLGLQQSPCRKLGVCASGLVEALCTNGNWSCDYTAVVAYEAGVELSCDDKDNDCDGTNDEDMTLSANGQTLHKGDACGSGSCAGVVVCNANTPAAGDLVCSSEVATGGEVCDRLDNDCDGQTDEGFTWTPPGGSPLALGASCDGYGVCGIGVVECGNNLVAVCSTNPDGSASQATAETCNRVDDDCDGIVDDGFFYAGLAPGLACDGVGECGMGVVECKSLAASTCSTNPDGSAHGDVREVCNGNDDDCDGQTDEGLTLADSTCLMVGVCTVGVSAQCLGAGGWRCDYGQVPGYHAGDELGLCDGRDNDCDGRTDEDYPELGQACDLTTDTDLCANGLWQCAPETGDGANGGRVPACVGDTPSPEVCGGGDEDCDGVSNEEGAQGCVVYLFDHDGDGFGKPNNQKCLCAPGAVPFYTALPRQRNDCDDNNRDINPDAREVCNDLDDNCNQLVDEGSPPSCVDYFFDGDGDGWGNTTNSHCFCFDHQADATEFTTTASGDCDDTNAKVNPGARERCDSVDNDCDQLIDDADTAPVDECTTFYKDQDQDTYGVTNDFRCRCVGSDKYTAVLNGDRCDTDSRVRGNQTEWFTEPDACGLRDYNCNGSIESLYKSAGSCDCGFLAGVCTKACVHVPGWMVGASGGTSFPACGAAAKFVSGCTGVAAGCAEVITTLTQACH